MWNVINHYANSDDPAEMQIALAGRYRTRFFLHEIADESIATRCELILFDQTNGGQRLLWKNKDSTHIHEVRYTAALVDNVIEEFIRQAAA